MINITIDLDNLDKSIEELKTLSDQVRDFSSDLAMDYRSKVGYSDVSVHHGGNVQIIEASGDQIAFEEWGAGYDATYEHGFTDLGGDQFESKPGIWSESHQQTFQHHQASGKQPSTYRYNKMPKHRMESTARRIQSEITQKARDYFK